MGTRRDILFPRKTIKIPTKSFTSGHIMRIKHTILFLIFAYVLQNVQADTERNVTTESKPILHDVPKISKFGKFLKSIRTGLVSSMANLDPYGYDKETIVISDNLGDVGDDLIGKNQDLNNGVKFIDNPNEIHRTFVIGDREEDDVSTPSRLTNYQTIDDEPKDLNLPPKSEWFYEPDGIDMENPPDKNIWEGDKKDMRRQYPRDYPPVEGENKNKEKDKSNRRPKDFGLSGKHFKDKTVETKKPRTLSGNRRKYYGDDYLKNIADDSRNKIEKEHRKQIRENLPKSIHEERENAETESHFDPEESPQYYDDPDDPNEQDDYYDEQYNDFDQNDCYENFEEKETVANEVHNNFCNDYGNWEPKNLYEDDNPPKFNEAQKNIPDQSKGFHIRTPDDLQHLNNVPIKPFGNIPVKNLSNDKPKCIKTPDIKTPQPNLQKDPKIIKIQEANINADARPRQEQKVLQKIFPEQYAKFSKTYHFSPLKKQDNFLLKSRGSLPNESKTTKNKIGLTNFCEIVDKNIPNTPPNTEPNHNIGKISTNHLLSNKYYYANSKVNNSYSELNPVRNDMYAYEDEDEYYNTYGVCDDYYDDDCQYICNCADQYDCDDPCDDAEQNYFMVPVVKYVNPYSEQCQPQFQPQFQPQYQPQYQPQFQPQLQPQIQQQPQQLQPQQLQPQQYQPQQLKPRQIQPQKNQPQQQKPEEDPCIAPQVRASSIQPKTSQKFVVVKQVQDANPNTQPGNVQKYDTDPFRIHRNDPPTINNNMVANNQKTCYSIPKYVDTQNFTIPIQQAHILNKTEDGFIIQTKTQTDENCTCCTCPPDDSQNNQLPQQNNIVCPENPYGTPMYIPCTCENYEPFTNTDPSPCVPQSDPCICTCQPDPTCQPDSTCQPDPTCQQDSTCQPDPCITTCQTDPCITTCQTDPCISTCQPDPCISTTPQQLPCTTPQPDANTNLQSDPNINTNPQPSNTTTQQNPNIQQPPVNVSIPSNIQTKTQNVTQNCTCDNNTNDVENSVKNTTNTNQDMPDYKPRGNRLIIQSNYALKKQTEKDFMTKVAKCMSNVPHNFAKCVCGLKPTNRRKQVMKEMTLMTKQINRSHQTKR